MQIHCTDGAVWEPLRRFTASYPPLRRLPSDEGKAARHLNYRVRAVPTPGAVTSAAEGSQAAASIDGSAAAGERMVLPSEVRHLLICNGQCVGASRHAGDVLAQLEFDLYQRVLSLTSGIGLHAAALCRGGRALVLMGPSGAGKSTLAWVLSQRGYHYLSDEYVFIRPDDTVIGLRRPIALKHPVQSSPPAYPYRLRSPTGETNTNYLVEPPPTGGSGEPEMLGALVCLSHGPDAADSFERLPRAAAIERLWATLWRRSPKVLDGVIHLVSRHPVFALHTRRVESAYLHVTSLA